jgi:methylated-DNA-protein-cysteine methyltransferase related protein
VDEETVERVRAAVRAIPPGRTSTYGEIAEQAGLRSPRLVGRILAEDGHDLPWHRVLRADGTCAPHIAREQSARLRAEGVLLVDGRLPRPSRRAPRPG